MNPFDLSALPDQTMQPSWPNLSLGRWFKGLSALSNRELRGTILRIGPLMADSSLMHCNNLASGWLMLGLAGPIGRRHRLAISGAGRLGENQHTEDKNCRTRTTS